LDVTGEDPNLPETRILTTGDLRALRKWLPRKYIGRPLFRIFQLSKDFIDIRTLTEKLKGIRATVIVIKTTTGKKFGGFMNKDWERGINEKNQISYGNYFGSKKAFLFSLDHKEKYALIQPNLAGRYECSSFGPVFGMDLHVDLRKKKQAIYKRWLMILILTRSADLTHLW